MLSNVYSGIYTHEGHDVNFEVNENGQTVIITESKDGTMTESKVELFAKAASFQDQLVKWGYTSL